MVDCLCHGWNDGSFCDGWNDGGLCHGLNNGGLDSGCGRLTAGIFSNTNDGRKRYDRDRSVVGGLDAGDADVGGGRDAICSSSDDEEELKFERLDSDEDMLFSI